MSRLSSTQGQAWDELQGLVDYPLTTPRELPNRLQNSMSVLHKSPQEHEGTRPVTAYLDRFDFACNASARWGGPRTAEFAAKARHAEGDIRSPDPFAEVLETDSLSSHSMCAAALGILDDAEARAALIIYLWSVMSNEERTWSPAGVANAVFGLAPSAFGRATSELPAEEKTILRDLCGSVGERLGVDQVATQVLRAWEEGWDRKKLLAL